MSTPLKLQNIRFHGARINPWGGTRPKQSWMPFGPAKGRYLEPYTAWDRDLVTFDVLNDTMAQYVKDENSEGIWTSPNAEGAFSHACKHRNTHYSYVEAGWNCWHDPYDIRHSPGIAPITNFSGMAFKWDRVGSYWSESAIQLVNVYLTIFDGEHSKTYQQELHLEEYHNLDPRELGDKNAVDNRAYYALSKEDRDWVAYKKRFMVGITFQFYQSHSSANLHTKLFRIYDMQPIYGNAAVPGGGRKQVYFDMLGGEEGKIYEGAIDRIISGGAGKAYLTTT